MDYINVKLALEYLSGNEVIFKKLKNTFLANHCNYMEVYNRLIESCDINEAFSYVHSIKGIALNLGAEKLNDICDVVLKELKKESWRKDLIDEFFKTLRYSFFELTFL